MKKFLLLIALLPQVVFGANPDFRSFSTADFDTNGLNITIKSNKWATVIGLAGKVDQTGPATNVSLVTQALYTTNTVTVVSPVLITGASQSPQANGTYTLSYSNTVGGNMRIIWTNGVNSTLLEYRSQTDNDFSTHMSVEATTNDFVSTFLYAVFPDQVPYAAGTGASLDFSDNITVTSTADVVTSFQVGDFSNLFLRNAPTPNTNIVVDKWHGNDTYASRTNGVAFATLGAACNAGLISGDIINVVTADYTDQVACNPPKGVIINGNYSTISAPLKIVDNNRIYNLTTGIQPRVTVTNSDSLTIAENIRVINSTDYMLIDDMNGEFQLINPINNGYWDSIIITKMRTNGVFKIINPQLKTMWGNNTGVTWGMHGVNWTIGPGEGGKVQVFQGSITVLNSTNLTFVSSVGGRGNSCFLITDKGGSTTNFGNASLEIYGTAFLHGSTNASVITTGLSNTLSIPISGYYLDNVSTGNPQTPVTSSAFVVLSSETP